MAIVKLVEDNSKQAQTMAPPISEGIQEILYFPNISDDLDNQVEEGNEEIWALDAVSLDFFKDRTRIYDEAANRLAEAQKKFNKTNEQSVKQDKKELEEAQENLRVTILNAYQAEKSDDELDPVPQVGGKKLIECVGLVNKRMFYVSAGDLKNMVSVSNRELRYKGDITSNKMTSYFKEVKDSILSESSTGEADENLKNKFWSFNTEIKKQWKFWEKSTNGQATGVFDFLLGKGNSVLLDTGIKWFNDTAKYAYNQKEQNIEKAKKLLEKKTKEFSHHHWGKVNLLVQEIWSNSKNAKFVDDFRTDFEDFPKNKEARKLVIDWLVSKELPEVMFDSSGGAQFMRYSANSGGVADLDFKDGKASLSYGADAKFSLAEAGAEMNTYFPHSNGLKWEFKVPVIKECFEPKLVGEAQGEDNLDPMFAHNSSFVLPAAIIDTAQQLESVKAQEWEADGDELLVQIVGHTDSTGDEDYNLRMGFRRATATHAFFSDNYAQWVEYFDDNIWKDEERDMMLLTKFLMKKDPSRLINLKVTDEQDFIQVVYQELQYVIDHYDYKISEIRSDTIRGYFNEIKDGGFTGGRIVLSEDHRKRQDRELVSSYIETMKTLALEKVPNVSRKDYRRFYVGSEIYPILSKGEFDLKVKEQGRQAKNRRLSLNLYGIERIVYDAEGKINLGDVRVKIHGQVSCFAGATIALSASAELNTNMGVAQLVGKKKDDDEVTKYKGNKPEPVKENTTNATASVNAFVGAKAEAALSAALEWNNPDKPKERFGLLASVGGSVTGTAGAGIEGEFKIGFDQKTNTFQVKAKLEATWGLGCGGAVSFTVGVQQLYDFIVMVYNRLEENDFDFVKIFEQAVGENGEPTESNRDVYDVYVAWVQGLWQQGDYFKAGAAAMVGSSAVVGFSLLEKIDKLITEFKEYRTDQEKTRNLVNNINEKPDMLRFVPPKVKGRMLFMIIEHKKFEFWDTVGSFDDYQKEEAAGLHIVRSIKHGREWQEVLEHLAIRSDNGKGFEVFDDTKAKEKDRLLRPQESAIYLRNGLLDDSSDWKKVRKHINKLPNMEKAWILEK